MEQMVENHEVDGAVTMHFPFPIGVSTVGRVVTPGKGKEMFIANTTGTSSADRIEGMIKNAVYGIIAAKTGGVENPTVGILNVDGARQTEMALRQLQEGGYDFRFAESGRADGGAVMRGNDVLQGTPDILVTDSLTGNVLIKMLSAYTTGGSFEATGYGYGPGIGKGYEKLILIISRASGAPLIANALEFAAQLVRGKVFDVAQREFDKAEKAGLNRILEARKASAKPAAATEETVKAPPAEPVTASIPGIEVMFKRSGRGYKRPYCVNPSCSNFLPEDQRGYPKKKTDENGENGESADVTETEEEAAAKTAAKTAAKKTAKKPTAKTAVKKTAKEPAAKKTAKKPAAKAAAKKPTAKKTAVKKSAVKKEN